MSTDRYTTQAAELRWVKSSYSGTSGGDCVEVASGHHTVFVRDSKATDVDRVLQVSRGRWAAFMVLVTRKGPGRASD